MAANMPRLPGLKRESETIGDWHFETTKHHMLVSRCHRQPPCNADSEDPAQLCQFCAISRDISFPLPEELYPNNTLRITHLPSQCTISFDAVQALHGVRADQDVVKVGYAEEWQEARKAWTRDMETAHEFDWTYTTEYQGNVSPGMIAEPTEERIDYQALSRPERILFAEELFLYADDFGDNGQAMLSVRMRAMPSSFLVLLRLIVRVDGLFIRVRDTRFYHRFGSDGVIREHFDFEGQTKDLEADFTDPNELRAARAALYNPAKLNAIIPKLTQKKSSNDKLRWSA